MKGLDKIIERIAGESAEQAEEILARAKEEAEAINSDALARTGEECAAIGKRAELSAESIIERGHASADLKAKQILLSGKQEVLSDTLDKARAKLGSLSDEEYRDLIVKLFKSHIAGEKATLLINGTDRERLSDGTISELKEAAAAKGCELSIAAEDAPIKNGFILDFGGIEENCTFDALFDQNIDELTDKVGSILFS